VDERAMVRRTVKDRMRLYVNRRTNNEEGFTALHYASFHGNANIIDLLMKHGADMHLKNKHGMSVLHLAAQNDQAYSLTYFKERGLSIGD
jgi:ankyrin repeat protein